MREDLMREVWQDLHEQQRRNEEEEARRRAEIRRECPAIGARMDRREEIIRESLRGVLEGKQTAENLPDQMERISAEIRASLKAAGYPEDYLTPRYRCPLCRDTGFVGDPIREECSCIRQRYQEKLRQAIGLRSDGQGTFESFRPEVFPDQAAEGGRLSQRQAMMEVKGLCERWADSWPQPQPRDVVLSGKAGLGKTFLLHCMANRLLERGARVLLISAYSFLETARRSYFENDGRMEEILETEVLLLDDLGSEPLMQNITIEQLFYLINERQNRNRPTVISTNLNRDELKKRYTERIASRLTDRSHVLFLPLEGRDIRNGR